MKDTFKLTVVTAMKDCNGNPYAYRADEKTFEVTEPCIIKNVKLMVASELAKENPYSFILDTETLAPFIFHYDVYNDSVVEKGKEVCIEVTSLTYKKVLELYEPYKKGRYFSHCSTILHARLAVGSSGKFGETLSLYGFSDRGKVWHTGSIFYSPEHFYKG